MTRKDTILVAVVINAGLLAVLFITAVIYDTEKGHEQTEFVGPIVDNRSSLLESDPNLIATASTEDEVDNVLKYYTVPSQKPIVIPSQSDMFVQSTPSSHQESENRNVLIQSPPSVTPSSNGVIEVVVKKGDVLEKIAKANKTTVGAIKRANQLSNERLSIGQVLKIPAKENVSDSSVSMQVEPVVKQQIKAEKDPSEPVYYIVASGDNPWKIAKQFGVKYDEILRLNNLDEEKARNLKIGDRIRVK